MTPLVKSRVSAIRLDDDRPVKFQNELVKELTDAGYRPCTARCCGGRGCPDCQGVGIEWAKGEGRYNEMNRKLAHVEYRNGYLVRWSP